MAQGPRHLIRRFAGLYGSANPYSVAPEGAMDIGDDCVIRSDGTLEPRRGYSHVVSAVPVNAIGWKEGKLLALTWDDVAHGVTGQLRSYDFTAGAFTALPMTPGSLAFDRPGGIVGNRTRFVSANKAIYFQNRYGLTKIEALSTNVCFPAVMPPNWTQPGPTFIQAGSVAATFGTGNLWLANNSKVAYRFTICRLGANKELIESEPSERLILSNTSGSAKRGDLTFHISWMVLPDAFARLYRTKQVAVANDPSDEMFLISELIVDIGLSLRADGYEQTGGLGIADQTPDSSLIVPLYTNPLSGSGIGASANSAPIAADMAFFKQRLLLLNTTDLQRLTMRIIGTGTGGIVDGDSFTIQSAPFTFRTTPFGVREIQLYTAGTVAQNIENTARDLVAKVNRYFVDNLFPLASTILARYIGVDSSSAGTLLFQSLFPGTEPFTVSTNGGGGFGFGNGWDRNYSTGKASDPNAQAAGFAWSVQDEPEAVPLENTTIVGDAASPGQRVIALKEAALIFKKDDGLWRFTDDGVNVALQIADPTVRLLAPETAQPISNYVLALCDSGVLLITENGQTVNISRDRVEQELLELISYVGRDTMAKVAFAVPYELEHQYILCLPDNPNATSCTLQYVYHLPTQTWQRWRLPGVIAGSVNPTTGQLVWAMGLAALAPNAANNLWVERKSFDSTDYKDPSFTIACPTNSAVDTMTFAGDLRSGASGIAIGDVVQQAQATFFIRQRVTAVSYNSGANQTTITLDAVPAHAWSTGVSLTVLKAIQSRLRFLPFHATVPLTAKEWGDPHIAFRFCDLDFASYAWTSEAYTSLALAQERIFGAPSSPEPRPPIIGSGWGSDPWGLVTWNRQTRDVLLKTTLPPDVGECAMLTLAMTLANAESRWELSLIGLGISGGAGEVVR